MIKPMNKYIVVELNEVRTQSSKGIYLPDSYSETVNATIVAVPENDHSEYQINDTVIVLKSVGHVYEDVDTNKTYKLYKSEDILAKII